MTTEEVVRAAVRAYEDGDLAKVLSLCHPNIRYRVVSTTDHPFHIDCVGLEEFERALGKFVRDFEFLAFAPQRVVVAGNSAATVQTITYRGRLTGAEDRTMNALFWTIENGRIVELLEFHDTATLAAVR